MIESHDYKNLKIILNLCITRLNDLVITMYREIYVEKD